MRRSVIVAALAVASVAPSPASAGTFEVRLCADAPSLSASAIVAANSRPATLSTSSACRTDPVGLFDGVAATDARGAGNTPAGSAAMWSVTAAPGTRIASARVRRYAGKRDNSWSVWIRTAEGHTLETCEIVATLSCTVGAVPTSPEAVVSYPALDTDGLAWGVSCGAAVGECVNGASLNSAWAVIYGATLTVRDPEAPQLQPISGSLVAQTRWHMGTEQATVAATDASGIRRLELLVDGAVLSSSEPPCDYAAMRPCPRDAQLSASVNLAELADGEHEVVARAFDAAGQPSITAPARIAVDTRAPARPIAMTASRNPDETVTARWTNPDQGGGAPVAAAHYQFCPLGSDGGCVSSGIVAGDRIASLERIRPPAGGAPWDLVVWLQDGAGHADRAAAARLTIPPTDRPNPIDRRLPPRAGRRPTKLAITAAVVRGNSLRVRGTAASAFRGRVRVALRQTRHGRPAARRLVLVRRGRFAVRFDLRPQRARRSRLVTVHFPGSRAFRSTTVARRVVPQRGGSR